MRSRSLAVACLLVCPLTLPAREVVHLTTGFDLIALSHASHAEHLILKTDSGTIELPFSQILSVDSIVEPPPAPASILPPAPQLIATPVDLLNTAALAESSSPEFRRLVRSVAVVESALHPDALSPKGAIGLMQLMPVTAKTLGVEATDPAQNARGGAKFLASLLRTYSFDSVLALAAYNAGPAAVEKYHGVPPFAETQAYVRRVLRVYQALSRSEP